MSWKIKCGENAEGGGCQWTPKSAQDHNWFIDEYGSFKKQEDDLQEEHTKYTWNVDDMAVVVIQDDTDTEEDADAGLIQGFQALP